MKAPLTELDEEMQRELSGAVYCILAVNGIARMHSFECIDAIAADKKRYRHMVKKLCCEVEAEDERMSVELRQRLPVQENRYKIQDLSLAIDEELSMLTFKQSIAVNNALGRYTKDTTLRDMQTRMIIALLFADIAYYTHGEKVKRLKQMCRTRKEWHTLDIESSLRSFSIQKHRGLMERLSREIFTNIPVTLDLKEDISCKVGADAIILAMERQDVIDRAIAKAKLNEQKQ